MRNVQGKCIQIKPSTHLTRLQACVQAAQKLVTRELGAYVEVEIAGDVLAKTNSKLDSRREPVWNEAFMIDVCHKVKHIRIRVCTLLMHVWATNAHEARQHACELKVDGT
jgi:hypothetical protein